MRFLTLGLLVAAELLRWLNCKLLGWARGIAEVSPICGFSQLCGRSYGGFSCQLENLLQGQSSRGVKFGLWSAHKWWVVLILESAAGLLVS